VCHLLIVDDDQRECRLIADRALTICDTIEDVPDSRAAAEALRRNGRLPDLIVAALDRARPDAAEVLVPRARSFRARSFLRQPPSVAAPEAGVRAGHLTCWLAKGGVHVTGLDASPVMLAEARHRGSPSCVLGNGLMLPLPARAVDFALLIATLEFVSDPLRARAEAARFARSEAVVGVLNRHSLLGLRHGVSHDRLRWSAGLFSLREVSRLVRQTTRRRVQAVRGRRTLWPLPGLGAPPLSWGGFVGLALPLKNDDEGV
jgi:hypothetical protein